MKDEYLKVVPLYSNNYGGIKSLIPNVEQA